MGDHSESDVETESLFRPSSCRIGVRWLFIIERSCQVTSNRFTKLSVLSKNIHTPCERVHCIAVGTSLLLHCSRWAPNVHSTQEDPVWLCYRVRNISLVLHLSCWAHNLYSTWKHSGWHVVLYLHRFSLALARAAETSREKDLLSCKAYKTSDILVPHHKHRHDWGLKNESSIVSRKKINKHFHEWGTKNWSWTMLRK